MREVNLLDGLISCSRIQTKERYMCLFYHLVNIADISSWFLYIRINTNQQESAIGWANFRKEILVCLCTDQGTKTTRKEHFSISLVESQI